MAEDLKEAVMPKASELSIVDKLRMLLDITKKISRSLDMQEVLNQVMDTLGSLIPYDAAGIYIIKREKSDDEQDDNRFFHAEAVRGYDIEELKTIRLKMGEGI